MRFFHARRKVWMRTWDVSRKGAKSRRSLSMVFPSFLHVLSPSRANTFQVIRLRLVKLFFRSCVSKSGAAIRNIRIACCASRISRQNQPFQAGFVASFPSIASPATYVSLVRLSARWKSSRSYFVRNSPANQTEIYHVATGSKRTGCRETART